MPPSPMITTTPTPTTPTPTSPGSSPLPVTPTVSYQPPPKTPSTPSTTKRPPPPPKSALTTPSTSKRPLPPPKSALTTPSTSSSSGLDTGVMVEIAIGAVAILMVLSLCCILYRKKKRRREEPVYYVPPPPPPAGPKGPTFNFKSPISISVLLSFTLQLIEKGPTRDYLGHPLMTPTDDSNPWWSVFKQVVEAVGGKLAKPEILASTTDAQFMRQQGIPTLGFSPMTNTPILLHEHNECLKGTVFLKGIKVYESIISALSTFEG